MNKKFKRMFMKRVSNPLKRRNNHLMIPLNIIEILLKREILKR
jgi:hypothetical protein